MPTLCDIPTTTFLDVLRYGDKPLFDSPKPAVVPLRVDFAGGWLDVPKFAVDNSVVVNCAIEPFNCAPGSGLGGSARAAILRGECPFETESKIAGWQDAAIVSETGLCVWRSGEFPVLSAKYNPSWLSGKMAVLNTGYNHDTRDILDRSRPYGKITRNAWRALDAVNERDIFAMAEVVDKSYTIQIEEGMLDLPYPHLMKKYLGSGWGGYALYMFTNSDDRLQFLQMASKTYEVRAVEPYMRGYNG